MKTYIEPEKELVVYGDYDVIVAGGGTAGMIAGIAAARTGAKTLVVERLGSLGGQLGGFMNTAWTFGDQVNQVVKGIPYEYFKRVEEIGGVENPDYAKDAYILYDSERAKYVITQMFEEEENLEVLYLTMVADVIKEGDKVTGIIIENKSGRQVVWGKQFVDCTGDSDLLAFAGAEFELLSKERLHPVSLIAKMGGVDTETVKEYYDARPELWKGEKYLGGLPHAGIYNYRLHEELEGIELPEELEYLRDWFILFYSTPNPGEMILNMTGAIAVDGTDAKDLSRAEHESRIRLFQAMEIFNKYIPGFEKAYISATAPAVGVRESRKVIGDVKLTADIIMNATKFPDAVCSYQAPLGYHLPDGKDIAFRRMKPGTAYDIPLRCMLPRKIDGVIVAGRNIAVETDAIGSPRSISNCMSMGQGAGTVAALAAMKGVEIRQLPYDELRAELEKQNVYFARS